MDRAACYEVPAWHRMLLTEQGHPHVPQGDVRAAGFSDQFVPELFHRLYAETPAEVPAPQRGAAARLRGRVHDLVSEIPEFAGLRRQTVRDPAWAAMATSALADRVAAALPVPWTTPDADRARRILDGLRALGVAPEDAAAAEGAAAGADFALAEGAAALDESTVRRAVRAGVAAAEGAIDAARAACEAFGVRPETGGAAAQGAALELARRVRSSAKLARIVEVAGRLRATARAKRATRSDYARSEIVGVERTGDIGSLLPCELGALASPLRTADLVRRLGERAALGFAVRGEDRTAKGPIVVCVDASGSMSGDRDVWAKAIALAILDIARSERRAFGLCLFSADLGDWALFADPAKAAPAEILRVLEREPAGGTAFGPPLGWALDRIADARGAAAFRRADVVLITDGASSPEGAAQAVARADALGASVFGVGIGSSVSGALSAWTHTAAVIDDVSNDTVATDLVFTGI